MEKLPESRVAALLIAALLDRIGATEVVISRRDLAVLKGRRISAIHDPATGAVVITIEPRRLDA